MNYQNKIIFLERLSFYINYFVLVDFGIDARRVSLEYRDGFLLVSIFKGIGDSFTSIIDTSKYDTPRKIICKLLNTLIYESGCNIKLLSLDKQDYRNPSQVSVIQEAFNFIQKHTDSNFIPKLKMMEQLRDNV